MQVLAFTRYDRDAASTRYRLLQFLPALEAAGIRIEWHSLLADGYMKRLVDGRRKNDPAVLARYAARLRSIVSNRSPDLIWVYGELLPYVPASIEMAVMPKGIPVIYDWDDAFHVVYKDHQSALVRRLLGGKFEQLLAKAAAVTCGNEFVRSFGARYCPTALVVPTVVDTERYRAAAVRHAPPVIGWIGSPSTWANVRPLLGLLSALHRETGVRIRAVGAGTAAEADRFDGLELVEWGEASEVAEVQGFGIGIMPLLDRPFERGKSGFKLIQYMACGLPTVASPVGVNAEIVTPDTGFIASTDDEWRDALLALIRDPALRHSLGSAGRERAVRSYSLASQAPRLVELFRSVAARR